MKSWQEIPLFLPALSFIFGILLYSLAIDIPVYLLLILGFSVYTTLYIINDKLLQSHRILWYVGNIYLVLLAGSLFKLEDQEKSSDYPESFLGEEHHALVVVKNTKSSNGKLQIEGKLNLIKNENNWNVSTDGCIVYFKTDTAHILPGDTILIRASFKKVESPKNKTQFDYAEFLERKGIYLSSWIDDEINSTKILGRKKRSLNRSNFIEKIDPYLNKPSSKGFVRAIVFGDKSLLSNSEVSLYRRSGVAHIMAVSGMHVGMVFGIIWMLLGKIPGNSALLKALRTGIALAGIWGFIGLATFPPSAVRSGFMFSLFLIAKALYFRYSSLNILCAAAIILLAINPQWLWDIGFQFSFLALLGILIFYPQLDLLWSPGNKLIKLSWSLTSLAISAQTILIPISIYYFHGLSTYFWMNAIPGAILASLIMMFAGLILLFSLVFPKVALIIGSITDYIIEWSFDWFILIQKLPYAYPDGIYISQLELLFTYLPVIFLVSLILTSNKVYSILFLCSLFLLPFTFSLTKKPDIDGKTISILHAKYDWLFYLKNDSTIMRFSSIDSNKNNITYLTRDFESIQSFTPHKSYKIPDPKLCPSIVLSDLSLTIFTKYNSPEIVNSGRRNIIIWQRESIPSISFLKGNKIDYLYCDNEIAKAIEHSFSRVSFSPYFQIVEFTTQINLEE